MTGLSSRSIAKLGRNENVTTDLLVKICNVLHCDICDIIGVEEISDNDTSVNGKDKIFRLNSFFAGIGGFDVAFERHGFQTKFLCEINPYCNAVLAEHWPKTKHADDIGKLDATMLPVADVWCGGFPCQDISVARGSSQRLGLSGERSGLFYQYASLMEECKPKVVIIENVGGLFNSNGGRDFGVIIQRMASMGYAVAWRLLNSRFFGVPQSRPRVYMCCWLNNPEKACKVMFDPEGAFCPHANKKDFLEESNAPNNYPKVPRVAFCLAATSGRHTGTDWSRTYIVCKDGVRRMTPIEYERLQGFPDLWTLPSSYANNDDTDTLRYTAIGNAVSVPVVEWLSARVYTQLIKSGDSMDFPATDMSLIAPEFGKSSWSKEEILKKDFSETTHKYIWPKAGVVWNNSFIGANIHPTPVTPIESNLYNIVEKTTVGRRYYLTPNAAEGILRRVDNQRRKLFPPLRAALEIEKSKKLKGE